jgi:hypothetical protein
MRFEERDLTEQYISLSFQDVLQQYPNTSSQFYILDGYGNVVFSIPSASIGSIVITSDITASMTVLSASYSQVIEVYQASSSFASSSISTSYAESASYSETSLYAESAGTAIYSEYAGTASLAAESISASYSETASYLHGTGKILGGILFDTASAIEVGQEGYVFWDNQNHTLALKPDKTGSTLQIGQEMWLRARAHEFIPDGSPVYIIGAVAGIPCVELAIADGTETKNAVVGVSTEDIPSGSIGLITTLGKVNDLDTSAYTAGDILYLSTTQSGSFQTEIPPDPFEKVIIGFVLNSDAVNGNIEVNVDNIGPRDYAFVGMINEPTITSLGGGNILIGTGSVNLCTTPDGLGLVRNYNIPSASFTLDTSSFLSAQYVVATYNSGSPVYRLDNNRNAVDSIQTTFVYTVSIGAGGQISKVGYDEPGTLLANKLLTRIGWTDRVKRGYGLVLGVSASFYAIITEGSVWQGVAEINLPAVNTAVDRFVLIQNSGSGFSGSLVTQLTNTQCDNGSGVENLGPGINHWVANYIYRGIGSLNTTVVMYSEDYGSLAAAQAGQPPTPPATLPEISILVGRVIYRKNVATPVQIDSAFVETFALSGITVHNELTEIQGGSVGQYYHLTSAEYAQLQSGTASYAINSLTASYAENAGSGGTTLETGSFYPISSSWSDSSSVSISSSYSLTASYAENAGGGGTTLETGSTYQITSSWAQYALTASYIEFIPSGSTESASYALTASYTLQGGLNIPNYDYSFVEYGGPFGQFSRCTYRVGGESGSIVSIVDAYYSGSLFIGVSKSLG